MRRRILTTQRVLDLARAECGLVDPHTSVATTETVTFGSETCFEP